MEASLKPHESVRQLVAHRRRRQHHHRALHFLLLLYTIRMCEYKMNSLNLRALPSQVPQGVFEERQPRLPSVPRPPPLLPHLQGESSKIFLQISSKGSHISILDSSCDCQDILAATCTCIATLLLVRSASTSFSKPPSVSRISIHGKHKLDPSYFQVFG